MDTSVTTSPKLATVIAEALHSHGVERIFGIPGGGSSLALIEAAGTAGIDFVLARTETAAALMAAVTAEMTGIPGVVMTGIGPGTASAINGVAYAYLEKAPLLLITDGPASSMHQDFDQQALLAPITKYQTRLRPQNGAAELDAAIGAALTPPWGPVMLELTAGDATTPITGRFSLAAPQSEAASSGNLLEDARALLARSRKPATIAGLEARHGERPAALRDLATALRCPVLTTYKAKGALPESHQSFCGHFTGAVAEGDILREADLIILYGFDPIERVSSRWGYEARILDLTTIDRETPGLDAAVRIVANLPETVSALLKSGVKSDWQPGDLDDFRAGLRSRLELGGKGHTAQSIMETLLQTAPEACRLSVDAGAHMFSAFACWQAEEPFGVLKSNGLSTMGYALPAAIASSLHEPDRAVAAVTGDGGMTMCLSELATAAEHDCKLVIVVFNDAALSLIDVKQQGQQYRCRGVRGRQLDFAACAKSMGCQAWRVEAGEALLPVLREAFECGGPALVDVITDAGGYSDQLASLRG